MIKHPVTKNSAKEEPQNCINIAKTEGGFQRGKVWRLDQSSVEIRRLRRVLEGTVSTSPARLLRAKSNDEVRGAYKEKLVHQNGGFLFLLPQFFIATLLKRDLKKSRDKRS